MTPEDLDACGDGLRASSSGLTLVAEHYSSARRDLTSAAERIPAAWGAPPAERLHASLMRYADGLEIAPVLATVARQVRMLASTADELAMELRRHRRAREEELAAATSARSWLAWVPADAADQRGVLARRIESHEDNVRTAERRIEEVVTRWEEACRRAEQELHDLVGQLRALLTSADVVVPALQTVVAAIVGLLWRGPDVRGGGDPLRPGALETSLTEFVRSLGPGPYTAEEYRDLAADYVVSLLPPGRETSIYARNEAVTRAYAELYFLDPGTYKWAGMAAFASDLVGDGIRQAEAARQAGIPIIPGVTDFSFTRVSGALQDGNRLVYLDIVWQHLAYEHGGIDAIRDAWEDRELDISLYQAWRMIDQGRSEGDEALVWEGNRRLLVYEQRITLQEGVYDRYPREFERLSGGLVNFVSPITSPIPGDDVTFWDHGGRDIGDFDQRWAWIEESILPAWQRLEPDLQGELQELIP